MDGHDHRTRSPTFDMVRACHPRPTAPGGRGDPVTGGIVVVVTFGALWSVCPGEATCGTTGAAALRVKVAFVDADPTTPLPGRRQVTVLSWSPG